MLRPPLLAGAVQEMVALPAPTVAVGVPGAPGTVDGITADVDTEGAPVPTELVAVTAKV